MKKEFEKDIFVLKKQIEEKIIIDSSIIENSEYDELKILKVITELPEDENQIRLFVTLEKKIIINVDKREDLSEQFNKYLKEYLEKGR